MIDLNLNASQMIFAPVLDCAALVKDGLKELTISPSKGSVVSSVLRAFGKILAGVALFPVALAAVPLVTLPLAAALSIALLIAVGRAF